MGWLTLTWHKSTKNVRTDARPFFTYPGRNEIWCDKESSKQHLRHEKNRKHLLCELCILNGTAEQNCKRGACHGKSVADREEDTKVGLESNHQVRNKDLKHDVAKRC
jgi:hypothetical protein